MQYFEGGNKLGILKRRNGLRVEGDQFVCRLLAARGRSLWHRVTAKQGRILGVGDETMLFHWEESTTTKTALFRRNPMDAWGFGPQALSFVGYDARTSCPPHFAPGDPKTLARDATDFCHGLLCQDSLVVKAKERNEWSERAHCNLSECSFRHTDYSRLLQTTADDELPISALHRLLPESAQCNTIQLPNQTHGILVVLVPIRAQLCCSM